MSLALVVFLRKTKNTKCISPETSSFWQKPEKGFFNEIYYNKNRCKRANIALTTTDSTL